MIPILEAVRGLTMVPDSGIEFTCEQTVRVVKDGIQGALVECGVWRGGCSIAMLMAQQNAFGQVYRPVHLMDSFEGLPAATERDGPAALAWQADTASERYYDNCRAARPEVEGAIKGFGFGYRHYSIWEGWFDDTLPRFARNGPDNIALLRVDCDWYDSVRCCLEWLVPRVSPGGVVILDDYYAWDGAARAAHDFLSAQHLSYRIRSLPDFSAAYFVKG